MLDVLENAGLLKNVCKGQVNGETKELHLNFTTDEKTKVKITGILGRKGLLDKTYYQNLHVLTSIKSCNNWLLNYFPRRKFFIDYFKSN